MNLDQTERETSRRSNGSDVSFGRDAMPNAQRRMPEIHNSLQREYDFHDDQDEVMPYIQELNLQTSEEGKKLASKQIGSFHRSVEVNVKRPHPSTGIFRPRSDKKDHHELEYHDDFDDEYSNGKDFASQGFAVNAAKRNHRLTSSTESSHRFRRRDSRESIAVFQGRVRSSSGDSSDPILRRISSGSSFDSQANDSFYGNGSSAMTSYVASLPLSTKLYIENEIYYQARRDGVEELLDHEDAFGHRNNRKMEHVQVDRRPNDKRTTGNAPNWSRFRISHESVKGSSRQLQEKESSDDLDILGCGDLFQTCSSLNHSDVDVCTSELFGITTTIAFCDGVQVPVFIPSATGSAMALSAIAGGVLGGPMGFLLGAGAIGLVAGYGQISTEYRDQLCMLGRQNFDKGVNAARKTTERVTELCSRVIKKTENKFQTCSADEQSEYDQVGRRRKIYGKWNRCRFLGRIYTSFRCDQTDEEESGPRFHDLNTLFDAINLFSLKHSQLASGKVKNGIQGENDDNFTKLRRAQITAPLNKIHALSPHLQPAGWMGVISSNRTTVAEKHEALQEILLNAKDKKHAKKLLEQGILDSLLCILSEFFQKFSAWIRHHLRRRVKFQGIDELMPSLRPTDLEKDICDLYPIAFVTSQCCLALGKAHCALVRSGGDEFYTISELPHSTPVWHTLAQLLYEIPHHLRTFRDDAEESPFEGKFNGRDELFVLMEWTIPEAQDIARLINCLANGRLDPRMVSTDPEGLIRVLSDRLTCS